MGTCDCETIHPKDLPDIKNPAGISHHHKYYGCNCGCEGLKQKVADLEYTMMQFQLQLDKLLSGGSINIHLVEHGAPQ